jgi:anti-sigma regulatory factor (Ser/Thr protein kinase)/anti-anti-sigma regulatory factor
MTESNLTGLIISKDVDRGAALIRFDGSRDPNQEVQSLHRFFDSLEGWSLSHIMVDMQGIDDPSGALTALLIAATVKMRRVGGDVKLLNLSDAARNHLSLFSPLTFLSIGADDGLIGHLGEDADLEGFDQGKSNRIRIEATVEALNDAVDFVLERGLRTGLEKIELSKLKIAVYEAAMNVIEHGYEFDPGRMIDFEVTRLEQRLRVVIADKGKPFNIYDQKDYNVESAFQEKREGGFGLYIIRRSVDEIHYESDVKSGNRLTLIKYF